MTTDMTVRLFQGIDEPQRCIDRTLFKVKRKRRIHVTGCLSARDNGLYLHRRAKLASLTNALAQTFKVIGIHRSRWCRCNAIQQKPPQMLAILVPSDQFTDILATGTKAARRHLLVNKGTQCVWKRDIHSTHVANLARLAKFGKILDGVAATLGTCQLLPAAAVGDLS